MGAGDGRGNKGLISVSKVKTSVSQDESGLPSSILARHSSSRRVAEVAKLVAEYRAMG